MTITREQIIAWARKAGAYSTHVGSASVFLEEHMLERFASLIEQATIERCAKVCEANLYKGYVPPEDGAAASYWDDSARECADAIRALKEKQA